MACAPVHYRCRTSVAHVSYQCITTTLSGADQIRSWDAHFGAKSRTILALDFAKGPGDPPVDLRVLVGVDPQTARMAKRLDTMCLKTKLCKYYLAGHCSWEGHCCYAHGRHELQIAPDLSKTKFCPILARQGVCLQPRCGFAHSKEELRRAPLLSSQRREMRSRGTALGASLGWVWGASGGPLGVPHG